MPQRASRQSLSRSATVLLDDPPTIEPHGDHFLATLRSGDAVFTYALTPHQVEAGILHAQAALAQWRVSRLDVVTPMQKRR